jgi:hypothetical protein
MFTEIKTKTINQTQMKKIFFLLAIVCSVNTVAQLKFTEDCTDLSGDCYIYPNYSLVVANSAKSKGFKIMPDVRRTTDSTIALNGLIVTLVNIGTCCEKNELIFLFADSTKMTVTSWNDFNCEGNAYYELSSDQANQLLTKEIIKAQMTNGYSYDTFANKLVGDDRKYFMKVHTEVKANRVTVIK